MKKITLIFALVVCWLNATWAQQPVPVKPRIIISTDIGGTDPDDNQSFAHFLMYSDCFDTEGLISSPSYGSGNKEEMLRMVDLYEKDLSKLHQQKPGLVAPDSLRAIIKQGRWGRSPYCGYSTPTEGSEWIVTCARRTSDRPLWILVWGGLDDVAQALHDAPDIADRIRVYWIGGPNKKWSVYSYEYIVTHFPNLWFIENNSSYRGFIGDTKVKDIFNAGYYDAFIRDAGYLGKDYAKYYKGQSKLGDTPSLLYIMDGDPNDPYKESWGGSFRKVTHTPRTVFDRPTTANDTIEVCSIVEFRVKGPVTDVPADSACITLDIRNQKWEGYYLGNGIYSVRHSTYYTGTLAYTITSTIPGFKTQTGAITVKNEWDNKVSPTDYRVGNNWYTDKNDPEEMDKELWGYRTIARWRNAAMADWGKRWSWLKEK